MSTHLYAVGYIPADEKWEKMKRVWDYCESLEIPPPQAVLEFFDHEYPGNNPGREVDIDSQQVELDGQTYIEIDVDKLGRDIKYVRFYVGW